MPRRIETITIEDEGRDQNKVFIVTEMPATMGEKWAAQLLMLIAKAGAELPEGVTEDSGMAGVAALKGMGPVLLSALHDPSLESWWDCVRYQHKPGHPPQPIEQGTRCQIEEIATITRLRMAVLEMHTGFFSVANESTSASSSAGVPTGSSPTRISRPRSVPLSPPGRRPTPS